MFKKLLPLSTLLLTSMTFAQTNPLSVHVLNLENGLPSAQVEVVLEKSTGNKWVNEPYRVCRRLNILRDYPDDKIKIYP